MEISFVFYDDIGNKLRYDENFEDMEDSIAPKTLPRIGEAIVFDSGSGFEEFIHLEINGREYLEKFLDNNYKSRGGQFKFIVIDIVHFTAGDFGSIHLKPKTN